VELGLAGRRAIICAASRGLGFACANALAREGVNVTIAARRRELLNEAATLLRERHGIAVEAVVADVASEDGRVEILARCPQPDILVTNCGGAPPGDFRSWSRADWIRALDANMLAAIFMIRATLDTMIARRFGRIVNITNVAIKGGLPDLGLSAGAVSGLTGFVSALARQTVGHNVTINNLVPGRFDTDRLQSNIQATAQRTGQSLEEARAARIALTPAGRFGDPGELGDACAYLCSAQAGYITGQNLVIDGGGYPGTF
jgi:3-oxoacyl-[acyl-carrier protein] reductase